MKLFRIGAIDYTLSRDEDRGKFWNLDFKGRVEYMRLRVARFLIEPCRDLLKISDDVQVGLIVPTVLCAGISAASTFQQGQQAPPGQDQNNYLTFISSHMDAALQADQGNGRTWAQWMYSQLRHLPRLVETSEGKADHGLRRHFRGDFDSPLKEHGA